jgi:hypothetical protein
MLPFIADEKGRFRAEIFAAIDNSFQQFAEL